MHGKGRTRGKKLRYIKNPTKNYFRRNYPVAKMRALKGQRHVEEIKHNRKPDLPESTIPEAVRADKDIE